MNEKEIFERHFFERFAKKYELPKGTVIKSESPDFMIVNDEWTLGIEISKIVNEREPGHRYSPSEQSSIEDRISQDAKEIFLKKFDLPLHVDFGFQDSFDVRDGRDRKLAEELANLVLHTVSDRSLEDHYHVYIQQGLPDELNSCGISFFPGITDSIWYAAKAKFLPTLTADYQLRLIQKKELRINNYKQKVDEIILLLIEGVPPESWFDKVEAIEQSSLNSRFDRIFILRNLYDYLVTVK